MRTVISWLFYVLIFAGHALGAPTSWAIICQAPCQASDGSVQPPGTVIGTALWDTRDPWTPPANTVLAPYSGQTIYVSPALPTIISASDFVARFTPAEEAQIVSNGTGLIFWLTLNAYGQVNVADNRVTDGMAKLVALGLISQARATQILNLSVPSP